MKKLSIKIVALLSAAALCVPAYAASAAEKTDVTQTKSVFDASDYCDITAQVSRDGVTVSWSKIDGADRYSLYRDDGSGSFKLCAVTKKLSYTDKNTEDGYFYRYKVYAESVRKKNRSSEILHVGLPKGGEPVIYTFDVPRDYGTKRKLSISDFDIYDDNSYKKRSRTAPAEKNIDMYGSYEEYDDDYYDEVECGEGVDYDYYDDYDSVDLYEGYEGEGDVIYEPAADEAPAAEEDAPAPVPPSAATTTPETASADSKAEDDDNIFYYSGNDNITAGTLTAGRWSDNSDYSGFKKTLGQNEWQDISKDWNIAPGSRYVVSVRGKNSLPLENVTVSLTGKNGEILFSAKTDNKGTAYVYTGFGGKNEAESITTGDGDEAKTYPLSAAKNNLINVQLDRQQDKPKLLDLMLTIDSTGSMGDEMEYIEAELKDVVSRVKKNNRNVDVRISVNFYRDTGDKYVYRSYDFRTSTDTVTKSLAYESANGGGDYPEAVHTALDVSVNKHTWNEDSTKLMFMVLDAPPHNEQSVAEEFSGHIAEAAEKGIRIIPVVSSGADTETEFLMRTAAAATGGTYLFLTDHSGVGNSHKAPEVGQYEIKKLNDLMVEVIDEYLE